MRNLSLALILGSFIAGCSETAPPPPEPPAPHTVSREDIIDFCNSVSSDPDLDYQDLEIALSFGVTAEQAEAMEFGAYLGRVAHSAGRFRQGTAVLTGESKPEIKPYEKQCRKNVREQLAKLKSEK